MKKTKLVRHMIASNKKTFYYTFKMMLSLQDQIEKMVIPCLEQYQIPNEGKKNISDWFDKSKKSQARYRKMIEDGFDTLELYF